MIPDEARHFPHAKKIQMAAECITRAFGKMDDDPPVGIVLETPAEIRMLKILGADVVGMSLPPEIIAARHAGMRCAGLACVSNMAAGVAANADDSGITHTHKALVVEQHAETIATLLRETISKL